jgi:hypothetical protein
MARLEKGVEKLQKAEDRQNIHDICEWLSPINPHATQIDVYNRRQKGTGTWLIESEIFNDWLSSKGGILWCPGIRKSLRL